MKKDHLRLVVDNGSIVPRKRTAYWWRRMHPIRALQVPVFVMIIISAAMASFFVVNGSWHAASTMWLLSFIFMFLFWALEWSFECKIQEDFDLYKIEMEY